MPENYFVNTLRDISASMDQISVLIQCIVPPRSCTRMGSMSSGRERPWRLVPLQVFLSRRVCCVRCGATDMRVQRSREALVKGSINGPANHLWREPARRSDARPGFAPPRGTPRCEDGMLTGICTGTPQRYHSSRDAWLSGGSPGPGWSRGEGGAGIYLQEILSRG